MEKHTPFQEIILVSTLLLAALFLLPAAVVAPFQAPPLIQSSVVPPAAETNTASPTVSGMFDHERALRVLTGNSVTEMTLDNYLYSVVAAEMPAAFESEALKAQAVAARTYTLYQMHHGGRHGDTAHICTDSTCCQAYISPEDARANWGISADIYQQKIADAIAATDGQVILYSGEPILAVFHAASAGQTRAAGQVWSSDLPYLQAVSSSEPTDAIPDYYSRAAFAPADFRKRILSAYPEAKLDGAMETWLKNAVTDDAGNIETVEAGGVSLRGSTLRSLLGLRSACFTWEAQDDQLVFFVTGYGHGVGLSQYGANQMAEEGADYRDILTHYYTNVTVERLPE